MTRTEATRLARRQLSHGHFADADGAHVLCPRCLDHDVQLYATMGRLPHGEMVRQLTMAVLNCALNAEYENEL